jgi:hypothetical protein
MTLGQAWPFPEPPCYHGQACSGTGPDCGPDEDFCWPRLGRHVDPHTCGERAGPATVADILHADPEVLALAHSVAEYQSWCESEAVESRRHALKQLDEATA